MSASVLSVRQLAGESAHVLQKESGAKAALMRSLSGASASGASESGASGEMLEASGGLDAIIQSTMYKGDSKVPRGGASGPTTGGSAGAGLDTTGGSAVASDTGGGTRIRFAHQDSVFEIAGADEEGLPLDADGVKRSVSKESKVGTSCSNSYVVEETRPLCGTIHDDF